MSKDVNGLLDAANKWGQFTPTAINDSSINPSVWGYYDNGNSQGKQYQYWSYDDNGDINMFIPIYRTLFDSAIKEVLSRETNHKKGNVYFIIDEFRLLPYLQFFDNAINFGREKGLKIIAGLQSVEQLYSV
jgi:hypothetical protein